VISKTLHQQLNATQKQLLQLEVEAALAAAPKVLFQQEKFYRRNKNSQMRKIIAKD
jgi:hypothetical protein